MLVVTAGCVGVAPAESARSPGKAERVAIVRAYLAESKENSPEFRAPCVIESSVIRISIVNSRWAFFGLNWRPQRGCRPSRLVQPNAMFFHRLQSGAWRYTTGGSDITCDQRGLPPPAVQRDLGLVCRKLG